MSIIKSAAVSPDSHVACRAVSGTARLLSLGSRRWAVLADGVERVDATVREARTTGPASCDVILNILA